MLSISVLGEVPEKKRNNKLHLVFVVEQELSQKAILPIERRV
jgi:hypothetical protein